MSVVVVTPPVAAVSPADVRTMLRAGDDVSDVMLLALIAAVQGTIDGPPGWLGRAIGVQTLELQLAGFPCVASIDLPYPPAVSIVALTSVDPDGTIHTYDPTTYELDAGRFLRRLPGASWRGTAERDDAVRVRYQAGYPDAAGEQGSAPISTVPAPIRAAIALGVRELLTTVAQDPSLRSELVEGVGQRQWTISADTTTPLQQTTERLLSPFRVFSL